MLGNKCFIAECYFCTFNYVILLNEKRSANGILVTINNWPSNGMQQKAFGPLLFFMVHLVSLVF